MVQINLSKTDNICILSENIKFICMSFRNRKKSEVLASTNTLYVSRHCTYIVFIPQCHVSFFFNLSTKRHKHQCYINTAIANDIHNFTCYEYCEF